MAYFSLSVFVFIPLVGYLSSSGAAADKVAAALLVAGVVLFAVTYALMAWVHREGR